MTVELDIDGPQCGACRGASGLSRDGSSTVYRLPVPAGERLIQVRLRDDVQPGFAYTLERRVKLAPAQVLVIDFNA
ncbi:MAG: hypothetical protein IPM99_06770, partial [Rubrivivax sp.]|nr:hypothetical protein [Rubrivivax sp.]